jgi:hypothetical protein
MTRDGGQVVERRDVVVYAPTRRTMNVREHQSCGLNKLGGHWFRPSIAGRAAGHPRARLAWPLDE